jgi:hypothetical protein
MRAAAGRDNVDQPADLLTAAGAVSAVTRSRLRLVPDDDDRWATEGEQPREHG